MAVKLLLPAEGLIPPSWLGSLQQTPSVMSPVPLALPRTLSLEKHSRLSLIKHISMQFLTPDRVQSAPIYPTRDNLGFLLAESDTTKAKSILWLTCGRGLRHLSIISDFRGDKYSTPRSCARLKMQKRELCVLGNGRQEPEKRK